MAQSQFPDSFSESLRVDSNRADPGLRVYLLRVYNYMALGLLLTVLRSLRWHPPSFAQRVLAVRRCGWSGLNSARAVARVSEFAAAKPGAAQPAAQMSASEYETA
jgi:hypothetical protein